MAVRDVIVSLDKTDPFGQLKKEVIERCGETKPQEIRLGDQKHSKLLRIMKR